MRKSKKYGIAIWLIVFALSLVLLLIVPDRYTRSVYVTLIFDCVAFISQLILWLCQFREEITPEDSFPVSPAMTMSGVYLTAQFIVCAAAAIFAEDLAFKAALLLNIILMALMWVLILATLSTKNHTKRIDSRQKNHHTEL